MYTLNQALPSWNSGSVKSTTAIRSLIMVLAGVALMTLGSKLYIPIEPVPLTGQTFALFLITLTFGWRLSLASVVSWQMLGVCGLPVFASGTALGLSIYNGPTAGYLFGFLLVAGLCGYVAEVKQAWLSSLSGLITVLLAGHLLLFTSGVCWLSQFTGSVEKALLLGFYPFIPGDILKMILVTVSLPHTWKIIRKI